MITAGGGTQLNKWHYSIPDLKEVDYEKGTDHNKSTQTKLSIVTKASETQILENLCDKVKDLCTFYTDNALLYV